MPEWQEVYQKHAKEYARLVAREDHERNLPRALEALCSHRNRAVVELGAGTGRFTCMFAPSVARILAFDASHRMLKQALTNIVKCGGRSWLLGVALHDHLPIPRECADIVIAGWTLGHFPGWFGEGWPEHVDSALAEMVRVSRPGATAIIVETLGTGSELPNPPAHLRPYYTYLERARGFHFKWIRTDYAFESLAEAEHLCLFFFGQELEDQVRSAGSRFVPECTGIWWRTF
jgi:ubiquinone/menaquinone biosynthesis C-methylase UbiE